MTEIFHTEIDADGVAVLSWDLPGRSMNVMTMEGLAELDAAIDALLADDTVKGIVLTSAKPDFAGGMDLNILQGMKDQAGDDPAKGLFEGGVCSLVWAAGPSPLPCGCDHVSGWGKD